MPEEMERELKAQAAKKGFTGKRADRYVYGTMNKRGFMHGNKIVSKAALARRAKKRYGKVTSPPGTQS